MTLQLHDDSVGWLVTPDGAKLRHARFFPAAAPRATVLLLTGRNEFIEKHLETVAELLARGFAVFVLDWRGQGLSSRPLPERERGYVTDFRVYVDDLAQLVREVVEPARAGPLVILAHSLGAHIALRFLHDHPHAVAAAVLSAPMLDIVTGAVRPELARRLARLAVRLGAGTRYAPGMTDYDPEHDVFEGNDLTSDAERFEQRRRLLRDNPSLRLGGVTFGWLDAAFRSIELLTRPTYLRAIDVPILIVEASHDTVVPGTALARAARYLPRCRLATIQRAKHELLSERDAVRAQFWATFDEFLLPLLKTKRARRAPRRRR